MEEIWKQTFSASVPRSKCFFAGWYCFTKGKCQTQTLHHLVIRFVQTTRSKLLTPTCTNRTCILLASSVGPNTWQHLNKLVFCCFISRGETLLTMCLLCGVRERISLACHLSATYSFVADNTDYNTALGGSGRIQGWARTAAVTPLNEKLLQHKACRSLLKFKPTTWMHLLLNCSWNTQGSQTLFRTCKRNCKRSVLKKWVQSNMTLNALTAIFFKNNPALVLLKLSLSRLLQMSTGANTTFGILELGIPHFSQHFSPLPG